MCQILLDSDKKCLNYTGFKYGINANPSCEVTIFVKGGQNVQFSFHIFFSRFFDTLKAHISGTETDINKG